MDTCVSGSIKWIIESTLTKGVIGIYWYVYLIAGLYLITPLLRMMIAHAGKKAAVYLTTLVFSIVLIFQLFPSVLLARRFACDNLLWIGYYVLGYLIVNTEVNLKEKHLGQLLSIGLIVMYVLGVGDMLIIGYESIFHPLITIIEAVVFFIILSKREYSILKMNKVMGGHFIGIGNKLWDVSYPFSIYFTIAKCTICKECSTNN